MTARRRIKLPTLLITLVVSVAVDVAAQSAELGVLPDPSKRIPVGVYDIDHTLIIPRQRALPHQRDKAANGVPAPYLAKESALPGGMLRGDDRFATVLRFDPSIKGALIKTEGYGDATVGGNWNDGNTQGDLALRANLCSSASDFTVDGRAEIRAYPWDYTKWAPKPDPHGPDHPRRADGLCAEGNGFSGERLRFFQIPGTALRLRGGHGKQAGAFGIYDFGIHELDSIWVSQALGGVVVDVADAKLRQIFITGIVGDGLTINGSGTVVDVDHIYGADRAAVIAAPAEFHAVYHESARIGTHILPGADGTRIDGLNIGPGTCWQRGVKIEANGCTITGLHGTVQAESDAHPDIAGVEIAPGLVHQVIAGELVIAGDGSDGVILRGHRNKLDLKGGWNAALRERTEVGGVRSEDRGQRTEVRGQRSDPPTSVLRPPTPVPASAFVRVAEGVTGCTVELRGSGNNGTVLDLSASGLDRVNGLGNEFKLKWSGTATRVIYPGGGTAYNLAPGTQLSIDGQLQSATSRPRPLPTAK